MASASEKAGLFVVGDDDLDAAERALDGGTSLPGFAPSGAAPEDRYRAPVTSDEQPGLVPKKDAAAPGGSLACPRGRWC